MSFGTLHKGTAEKWYCFPVQTAEELKRALSRRLILHESSSTWVLRFYEFVFIIGHSSRLRRPAATAPCPRSCCTALSAVLVWVTQPPTSHFGSRRPLPTSLHTARRWVTLSHARVLSYPSLSVGPVTSIRAPCSSGKLSSSTAPLWRAVSLSRSLACVFSEYGSPLAAAEPSYCPHVFYLYSHCAVSVPPRCPCLAASAELCSMW